MMRSVRAFAIGDPQARFDHVVGVLAAHDALAADGSRLADDVVLVSIGDHFDFDRHDPAHAAREGTKLLRWLASHPREQVRLLLGNHDVARVSDLIALDDARFATAAALGRSIADTRASAGSAAAAARVHAEFTPRFPELATPALAARDYAAYTVEQRALVAELLLAGRFELAIVGALADGRSALLTHAAVTTRELALLAIPDAREPRAIAAALAAALTDAVDAVRADWQRGTWTPLPLAPLHVVGVAGEEGGGMLYHRPTNPERAGADLTWQARRERPRRYDPRTLPRGLTQIAGHTGHRKCVEELDAWCTDRARAHPIGGIRTLRVSAAGDVCYDIGVLPPLAGAADLILIDGEMRHVPASEYSMLRLAGVEPR